MIAILAWVVATGDMIAYALAIAGGVFVLAIAYLGWATWLTSRRDRKARLESADGWP